MQVKSCQNLELLKLIGKTNDEMVRAASAEQEKTGTEAAWEFGEL